VPTVSQDLVGTLCFAHPTFRFIRAHAFLDVGWAKRSVPTNDEKITVESQDYKLWPYLGCATLRVYGHGFSLSCRIRLYIN
jgi:hypothetical protein